MKKTTVIRNAQRWILACALLVALWTTMCSSAIAQQEDCQLVFSDQSVTASGNDTGVSIDGTQVKISESGVYVLTGSCSEGSVTVKKDTQDVTLILENLNLAASDTAPIVCGQNTTVTIQVNGENTLTDQEDPALEDTSEDFEGAAIKVKSNASLLLTGESSLTVEGACKNGIKGGAEAQIVLSDLTLTVTAENNALACDGSLVIQSGTIDLTAGNDAIKAEPDEGDDASQGTVTIEGGDILLTADGDGIQATGPLVISGGTLTVVTGGGHEVQPGEDSAKGIKSDDTILISGGTIQLDCSDDGVHGANEVRITGGVLQIASGDDAVHADYDLIVGTEGDSAGPEIAVSSCVEGFEGATVTLYSGTGTISASDDGMNAANSDLAGTDFVLSMYGGTWYVDAGGDALDSNGEIYFYGGSMELYGAANGGDSALDYETGCTYEGGTILGVGMSGMAEVPSTGLSVAFGASGMMGGGRPGGMGGMGGGRFTEDGTSTDPRGNRGEMTGDATMERPTWDAQQDATQTAQAPDAVVENDTATSVNISAGNTLEIQDSSGNVIVTATAVKNANHVFLCDDSLVEGETYTLLIDGVEAATATAEMGSGEVRTMGRGGEFSAGRMPQGMQSTGYEELVELLQQGGLALAVAPTPERAAAYAVELLLHSAQQVTQNTNQPSDAPNGREPADLPDDQPPEGKEPFGELPEEEQPAQEQPFSTPAVPDGGQNDTSQEEI